MRKVRKRKQISSKQNKVFNQVYINRKQIVLSLLELIQIIQHMKVVIKAKNNVYSKLLRKVKIYFSQNMNSML